MPNNSAQPPVIQPAIIDDCVSSKPSTSSSSSSQPENISGNSAVETVFRGPLTFEEPKPMEELKSKDVIGKYRILQLVITGGFGQIFLGIHKNGTGKIQAMKILKTNNPKLKALAAKEIEVMKRIRSNQHSHAHLVVMSDYFDYGQNAVIVMEMLDCDLFDYMIRERDWKPLRTKVVLELAKQIFKGNAALLDMGIVHADLKLENIMLVDRNSKNLQIKIIDYGCVVSRSKANKITTSTLTYRAPECVLGLPTCAKVDSWSLGIVLYEIYTGKSLFEAATLFQLIRQHHSVTGLPDNYLEGSKTSQFLDVNDNVLMFKTPSNHKDKPAGWEHHGFANLFKYSARGRAKKSATVADNLICDLVTGLINKNASERPSSHSALLFLQDGIPADQLTELGLI